MSHSGDAAQHPPASDKLREYLRERAVDATLIQPGSDMPTVPLAAAALGVEPGQIVKSIVFEGKKQRDQVGLAIAPGDLRVDVSKVGAALGYTSLKLAQPDTVLRAAGYAVGGVPPVGHSTPIRVVIDKRVLDYPFVYGGGGDEQHMLRISPADIVRLTEAVVADITSVPVPASPGKPS
ncbi:aminoacyl-tRNA deacylase [Melittangium boletus]|uniref:Cys-tRNA(Pro) deacylase n=1 Tax=Melittangium boletus DSM 14713 TaxID=1294270 RepID=A0A250ISS1_9BACT|nr:YbaK/EbsC family protein [Melittangium boletus]ATB34303.1 Cys-tRNA(Pro) deacylase [Melittangium boletus DSM 14713]